MVSRIHRNIIVIKRYLKLKIDKTRAWETGRRCEYTLRERKRGKNRRRLFFSFFRPNPHRFPQNILRNEGRGGIFESHGAFVSLIAKKIDFAQRCCKNVSIIEINLPKEKKPLLFIDSSNVLQLPKILISKLSIFPLKAGNPPPPFPIGINSRGRGRGGRDKDVFLLLSRIFPYKFLFADAGEEDEGETRRKLAQNPHPNTLFPPTTQYTLVFLKKGGIGEWRDKTGIQIAPLLHRILYTSKKICSPNPRPVFPSFFGELNFQE